MSKQVKVGFIGVGAFVSGQHLPNAAGDPNLCVHTLCDLNEKLLKDRAGEYHPEKARATELRLASPALDYKTVPWRKSSSTAIVGRKRKEVD